ncbi:MAG: efflux RND transporter periplasmic adaptor subunit [Pseudohongiellaceae bacterium]
MNARHLVAMILFGLMVGWMALPRQHSAPQPYAPLQRDTTVYALSADDETPPDPDTVSVRVARISEDTFQSTVSVRGRTRADRHVPVRAEVAGQVTATPVPRGGRVEQGDLLCRLEVNGRDTDLQEAVSREEQARMEYEAELDLQERGLQGRVAIAQRKATLDAATAAVAQARLALERTEIRAPFSGILESRDVETGDYLDMGGECGTVLDDAPMLVTGMVPEHQIGQLEQGAAVTGRLITGEPIRGTVTYLSRVADPIGRSYRIEVELAPSVQVIRQGVTAEIFVDSSELRAHLVPASALTLNDAGNPGLKTVNRDSVVEFHEIRIVGEETGPDRRGLWVTGLPTTTTVVTLGQELVFPGQAVRTDSSTTN